jgi:hypothetical protein
MIGNRMIGDLIGVRTTGPKITPFHIFTHHHLVSLHNFQFFHLILCRGVYAVAYLGGRVVVRPPPPSPLWDWRFITPLPQHGHVRGVWALRARSSAVSPPPPFTKS